MGLKEIIEKFQQPATGDAAKNKKIMLLMPVLIIVLIFVLARAFKTPVQPCAAAAANTKTAADAKVEIKWDMPDVYPANLRDPMKPGSANSGKDDAGDIIIRGIIYSDDRPSVIINETIMHTGDKVAGATIVKITKKNVEFEKNDKRWTQDVQQ